MSNVSLHQFLVLYTWFPLVVLLLLMLLIARFYQRFSGEHTYFWLYSGVIILYGAATVRFASTGLIFGDVIGDSLSFSAGCTLLFLSILLYRRMLLQASNKS